MAKLIDIEDLDEKRKITVQKDKIIIRTNMKHSNKTNRVLQIDLASACITVDSSLSGKSLKRNNY